MNILRRVWCVSDFGGCAGAGVAAFWCDLLGEPRLRRGCHRRRSAHRAAPRASLPQDRAGSGEPRDVAARSPYPEDARDPDDLVVRRWRERLGVPDSSFTTRSRSDRRSGWRSPTECLAAIRSNGSDARRSRRLRGHAGSPRSPDLTPVFGEDQVRQTRFPSSSRRLRWLGGHVALCPSARGRRARGATVDREMAPRRP